MAVCSNSWIVIGIYETFKDQAFATYISVFASVFIAYWLYKAQQNSSKEDAAKIVLSEIRAAFKAVDKLIAGDDRVSIMPTNSWSRFNHLFVKDLSNDELDSLKDFYDLCSLAERELERIRAYEIVNLEEKVRIGQRLLADIVKKHYDKNTLDLGRHSDFVKERDTIIINTYGKDGGGLKPDVPQQKFKKLCELINSYKFILTSSIGMRLKKIASLK